jgi:hypothetical protein
MAIRDRDGLEALACECFGVDHAQLNHTADQKNGEVVRYGTA